MCIYPNLQKKQMKVLASLRAVRFLCVLPGLTPQGLGKRWSTARPEGPVWVRAVALYLNQHAITDSYTAPAHLANGNLPLIFEPQRYQDTWQTRPSLVTSVIRLAHLWVNIFWKHQLLFMNSITEQREGSPTLGCPQFKNRGTRRAGETCGLWHTRLISHEGLSWDSRQQVRKSMWGR